MQNLSTAEMTKYLKNIVDLECLVYRQNEIINSSENAIYLRKIVKRDVPKPKEPRKVPDIGEEPQYVEKGKYSFTKALWIGTAVCPVGSLLLMILYKRITIFSIIIGLLFLVGAFFCLGDFQLSSRVLSAGWHIRA